MESRELILTSLSVDNANKPGQYKIKKIEIEKMTDLYILIILLIPFHRISLQTAD